MIYAHSRSTLKAFSLLELLVVLVVIALLFILIYPYYVRFSENSISVGCASRMRQVGVLYLEYANDQGGTTRFFRDGTTTKMWYDELRKLNGWNREQASSYFSCPSFENIDDIGPWWCYGMRLHGSPGRVVRITDEDGKSTGVYELNPAKVEQPSNFFLLVDSITSNLNRQSFRVIPPDLYAGAGVQVRHTDKANVLFLDGHIESLDKTGLARIGVTTTLDSKGLAITTPVP